MIDEKKYEGHTEGLWFDGEPTKISNAISNAFLQLNPNEIGKANARLAVDAPLLLAEVKRLREENRELEEFLNGSHRANQSYSRRLLRAQKWAYKQVLHNDSLMMDYDDYVWGEEE